MLESERLLYRRLTMDDLPEMIEMRTDEEVNRYLGGSKMQTPEFIEKRMHFYQECYEKFGFGVMAMIYKPENRVVGWSGLQPLEDTGEIEVGYGFIKEFWGRGLGKECARFWLDYGFNTLNLERIVAVASPENVASWTIMKKLGMTYEKTETHYQSECVFYAISKEEFNRLHQ